MSELFDHHKIEIMKLAISSQSITADYEELYKKMIDLIANYNPKSEKN